MKLTIEQIQQLYKFTRQHYVEHYDLQTELVDHLANDIEQIWKENPSLSFEQARNVSFKKFGVFGFMDVISERQKALDRKYWKIIFRFVKEWFQLPKIVLTALLFLSFYSICKTVFANYILLSILIVLFLFTFYKGYILQKTLKNNFKKNGKKWMLEDMIFRTGIGSFLLLPINFFNFINIFHKEVVFYSDWFSLLISFLFTFIIILFYIILVVLPQKAAKLLTENYSEYNFK